MGSLHLLIIHPSPEPPSCESSANVYGLLSRRFSGAVITTQERHADRLETPETLRKRAVAMGHFSHHPTQLPRVFRPFKFAYFLSAFVCKAIFLHFARRRFDAVVTYGPYTTALAGYVLKKVLRIKFVMEMPGDPFAALEFSDSRIRRIDRIKIRVGKLLVPFLLKRADRLKLLYPGQLDGLIDESEFKVSYFASFVPSETNFNTAKNRQPYLLFAGHPYYLKGVDLLIPAFLSIADLFPGHTLRIVGWCPNCSEFEKLASGDTRVEFCGPVPNKILREWMRECTAFVLPSRTEGVPRVLREAMAAQTPVIASRVGGIPCLIEDRKSGLLFDSGSQVDLAAKIKELLGDEELRKSIAQAALTRFQQHYLEQHYLDHYIHMIDAVMEHQGSPDRSPTRAESSEPCNVC